MPGREDVRRISSLLAGRYHLIVREPIRRSEYRAVHNDRRSAPRRRLERTFLFRYYRTTLPAAAWINESDTKEGAH